MMFDDMSKLFKTRLRQLLSDHYDTCIHADLKPSEAAEILMAGLVGELVCGACAIRMDRDTFNLMCAEAYRMLRPEFERTRKARRKPH